MDEITVALLVIIASGGVATCITIALAVWLHDRREREAARRADEEWWAQHRAYANKMFDHLAEESERLSKQWLELDQRRFEEEREAKAAGA